MGLFNKKKKKKLTQDQIITRISVILFVVILIAGLALTLPGQIQDLQDDMLGNVKVFDYLNEDFNSDLLYYNKISQNDCESLKTKLLNANIDIYNDNTLSYAKYSEIANAESFGLSPNEVGYLANGLLRVSSNKYDVEINEIQLIKEQTTTIKIIGSFNFKYFCNLTSEKVSAYKELGYTVPTKRVYITSSYNITNSTPQHIATHINALDSKKNNETIKFLNDFNSDIDIKNLLYSTLNTSLTNFSNKCNTQFAFNNNEIYFTSNSN